MDIVDPRIEDYLRDLLGGEHPVAEAMEREAEERDFPIVGRTVGVTLEVLAGAIGARRVLEMGSGYGYSAYWFARAVGDGGLVISVAAPPEKGRATEEARRALADAIGVRPSAVTLRTGPAARRKVFAVAGIVVADARYRLLRMAGNDG